MYWWIVGSVLLGIVLIMLTYVLVILCVGMYKRFQTEDVESVPVSSQSSVLNELSEEINVYTWNIGYACLDATSDFFYDGGKMMRPAMERVEVNLKGILDEINSWVDADVVLLQEVDVHSKRSWNLPLRDEILRSSSYKLPFSAFACNYDVKFVPLPWFQPMGRIYSGLLTLSKAFIQDAKRISYPSNFPFPKNLFFLQRCFLVTEFSIGQKSLLIVNTHNSAFDGGVLKTQEMAVLKEFLLNEYSKGKYIVVGGDWNQVPNGYPVSGLSKYEETPIPPSYPARHWTWAVDCKVKSNRKVDRPFEDGITFATVFDFYLLSPNVESIEIECLDRKFEFSDHQPVRIKFRLR